MAISGNQWQSVATSAYGDRAVLSIGRCTPRPAARGTVGAGGEGGAVVSTCMLGCIGARGTVGCLLRETIRRHQPSSGVITRHQPSSAVISRHQPSSEAISVPHTPGAPVPAISGNQRPSEAIRGHQRPSAYPIHRSRPSQQSSYKGETRTRDTECASSRSRNLADGDESAAASPRAASTKRAEPGASGAHSRLP